MIVSLGATDQPPSFPSSPLILKVCMCMLEKKFIRFLYSFLNSTQQLNNKKSIFFIFTYEQ